MISAELATEVMPYRRLISIMPHAAQFHESGNDLSGFADERVVNSIQIHPVIGNQLMAPLDEVQYDFTFAGAAGSGNQNAYAVNADEFAVAAVSPGRAVRRDSW